jgi:hypothetical protein
MANPDDYNLTLVEAMVKRHGIKIHGQDVVLTANDRVYQLSQHSSAPLSQIIKTTLHQSDNLYAQQLLRTIGLHAMSGGRKPGADLDNIGGRKPGADLDNIGGRKPGADLNNIGGRKPGADLNNIGGRKPGADLHETETNGKAQNSEKSNGLSLEARGLIALSRWLTKIGINGQEVILYDGCGLCRKNAVSPHALNMVLKHMAGEKCNGPYISLLKGNEEAGKGGYQYKTGTMDSVRAISGVLTTAGNQHLAVTIMVNGHTPSIGSLRIAQNALINQLRAISHLGDAVAKVPPGAPNDANITESANLPVVVDHQALKRSPKPTHSKRSKSKSRKRRH